MIDLLVFSSLTQAGIKPSVGGEGGSYDVFAETINGLYKAELIYRCSP
jgi:putative transposase